MVDFQSPNLNFFSASFEFCPTGWGGKRHTTAVVDFNAMNDDEAIVDARRFWLNRSKSMPNYFANLKAMTVSRKMVGPIKPDGSATTQISFSFFEWKEDHPESLARTIWLRIVRNSNRNNKLAPKPKPIPRLGA